MPTSVRRCAILAAVVLALTAADASTAAPATPSALRPTPTSVTSGETRSTRFAPRTSTRAPILAAAGDIADDGNAKFRTAHRVAALDPDRVVVLGDLVYDDSTLAGFRARWEPSWGRFDDIVWPVPGNHEYEVPLASGFHQYFGFTGRTWWSRRAGSWLVIGLDSERAGDARQTRFLRRRLERNDGRPTVVAWHRPRQSSGYHQYDVTSQPLWAIASVDPDVRIALWGHDHDYEHLAIPIAGRTTRLHAFVVGTGGTGLRPFAAPPTPNTKRRDDTHHGVLRLRLGPNRWRWAFIAAGGVTHDAGRRATR